MKINPQHDTLPKTGKKVIQKIFITYFYKIFLKKTIDTHYFSNSTLLNISIIGQGRVSRSPSFGAKVFNQIATSKDG